MKTVFLPITSSRDGWTLRRQWLLYRFIHDVEPLRGGRENDTIHCRCGASHTLMMNETDDGTRPKWVDTHGHHMPALPDEPPEPGNLVEEDDAGQTISVRPSQRWPDGRVEVIEPTFDGLPPPTYCRDPPASNNRAICQGCDVPEGSLHKDNCDRERCPFCGGQLVSCECANRHFYPASVRDFSQPQNRFTKTDREHGRTCQALDFTCTTCTAIEEKGTHGLPASVYFQGLTDEQQAEWDQRLAAKGRVAFIFYPSMCCRCGDLWPALFMVADEEWERYVAPAQRSEMLCRECYDWIKRVIDEARA